VVKHGTFPLRGVVAALTRGRETRRRMIWIVGLVKVREMATDTGLRRPGELSVDVALLTIDADMAARQREVGCRVVIEHSAIPLGRVVATLTRCRETCSGMIRIRRLVEVGKVTTHASLRCPRELAIDMTLRAIDGRVAPG
jgi:hypothetical protein